MSRNQGKFLLHCLIGGMNWYKTAVCWECCDGLESIEITSETFKAKQRAEAQWKEVDGEICALHSESWEVSPLLRKKLNRTLNSTKERMSSSEKWNTQSTIILHCPNVTSADLGLHQTRHIQLVREAEILKAGKPETRSCIPISLKAVVARPQNGTRPQTYETSRSSDVMSEPSTTKAAVIMAWTCSCHDCTSERSPFFRISPCPSKRVMQLPQIPSTCYPRIPCDALTLAVTWFSIPSCFLPFPSSNAIRRAACPKFSWRTPASPNKRKAIPTPGAQSWELEPVESVESVEYLEYNDFLWETFPGDFRILYCLAFSHPTFFGIALGHNTAFVRVVPLAHSMSY